jgi:Na+-transporting NADH:ubiquinone oxidoreductase subunit B
MFPASLESRINAISFRMLGIFVLASVPVFLLGIRAHGQMLSGVGDVSNVQVLLTGTAHMAPRLGLALIVSLSWAFLFARLRDRPLDPGWLYSGWMFILLMPAAVPMPLLCLGLSFGLLFGCHVFGGTGRYFVNPVALGGVFLLISYPVAMNLDWLPGGEELTTWPPGAVLAAACMAGALLLVLLRLASWQILAGGLIGMLATALLFDSMPWYWQPLLGNFAFVLAFLATDPTTTPETRAGRWALGLAFGAITVAIRMLNPEHPEGSLFGLLLASALAPLIDHLVQPPEEADTPA